MNFQILKQQIKQCKRCHLSSEPYHHNIVCGSGNIQSKIWCLGEANGESEDLTDRVFNGRCGKLLDKILLQGGLNRDDIYITNCVKCRPPKNRTPNDIELTACKYWLWQEIKLLNPQIIITLGKTPAQLLLKRKLTSLKSVLYQIHSVDYMQAKIYPCYHPSYLLRGNKQAIEDTVKAFNFIRSKIC